VVWRGLRTFGRAVLTLSPADFGTLIADEAEKWRKLTRLPTPRRKTCAGMAGDAPAGKREIQKLLRRSRQ
jgi:hypothetical protein